MDHDRAHHHQTCPANARDGSSNTQLNHGLSCPTSHGSHQEEGQDKYQGAFAAKYVA
jgi:hypothetical protein